MKTSSPKIQLEDKGKIERSYLASGLTPVGIDEVGRGCLAGPVVAACVKLDFAKLWALPRKTLGLIRDSKTLSTKQRLAQVSIIQDVSLGIGVGEASVSEIETLGIVGATFLAMNRSLQALNQSVDILLVDGNQKITNQPLPQLTVVKGDSLCFSIAAASIIAKETRDAFMEAQALLYPSYGFNSHVGYGTAAHLAAIREIGICPLHRKTFAPIRDYLV